MIVSSIPRSGSTKYCMEMAESLNLPFYDEIFEYHVNSNHKKLIHRLDVEINNFKDIKSIKELDFSKCVINNHEISFFTLEHSDIFISRLNVQDSIWSYISYMDQYLIKVHENKFSDTERHFQLRNIVANRLRSIKYFYDYCNQLNKPIVIPELTYTDNREYRTKYSDFTEMVNRFGKILNLPDPLIYQ